MRLTTERRRACLAVALGALVALAGCDGRKAPGTSPGTGPAGGTTPGPAVSPQTPRQAAEAFLKDLSEGKAGPERLTAEFRKQVPPPAPETAPKAVASDAEVREWLARFKDTRFVLGQDEVRFGNAVVFRGRAEAPNRRQAFTLRLVKDGDGYQADWLHASERFGMEIRTPADPELAAAQDTARNFLDIFLGGDLRQMHALMAPAWKRKLAPPYPADERAGLDHNPAFLIRASRAWRKDEFTGYALPKAELGPDRASATVTAEFQAGGRTVPYTVKVVKDPATGRWLVSDFDRAQS